jgi:P27 family predicted phage terminase small subunit
MPGTPGRSGGHNRKLNPQRNVGRRPQPQPAADSYGIPELPAWLRDDPIASEAWARITGLLAERGTITPGDGDAIVLACVAESEYRGADAVVRAEGLTVGGNMHPAVKVRESAWRRWSSALSRLGLDPITRPRVQAAPPRKINPFLEMKR